MIEENDNKQNQSQDNEQMVLLASFQLFEDAETIIDLLAEHDVKAYMRNEFSNRMLGSLVDVGGYRVEISSLDTEKALSVLSQEGIQLPDETESQIGKIANLADRLPFFKNKQLEFRLWAMLGILIILIGLFALAAYLLSAQLE